MELLHWELNVLSRAVAFQNLSGAATQVGLSQPQLSRIIAKLEKELGVPLLDRASKRKSGWTSTALRLAEIYARSSHLLQSEIQNLERENTPQHFRIGALEGLIPHAARLAEFLMKSLGVHRIELDIHDLDKLEERFFKGEFDFLLSIREPGKKKFSYSLRLGYQALERVSTSDKVAVFSSFEFHSQEFHRRKTKFEKGRTQGPVVISNSLAVRRHWVENIGGSGVFPSTLHPRATNQATEVSVFLLGAELLAHSVWRAVKDFKGTP
ncbi:LysR family transcriptional regulator [Bdellovibrionota bacterium FG-2]